MSFVIDLANECKLVGEKLVIVSHSIACLSKSLFLGKKRELHVLNPVLDYIQHLLPVFGIKYSRLDGSIPAKERQNIIDVFNEDQDIGIILLSAKVLSTHPSLLT